MKLKMYCVHDVKAQAYITPWFMPTEGMAKRTFSDCANDVNHQFGRNPQDYTLFYLGEFDQQIGKFYPVTPESLGSAVEYVTQLRFDDQDDFTTMNGADKLSSEFETAFGEEAGS